MKGARQYLCWLLVLVMLWTFSLGGCGGSGSSSNSNGTENNNNEQQNNNQGTTDVPTEEYSIEQETNNNQNNNQTEEHPIEQETTNDPTKGYPTEQGTNNVPTGGDSTGQGTTNVPTKEYSKLDGKWKIDSGSLLVNSQYFGEHTMEYIEGSAPSSFTIKVEPRNDGSDYNGYYNIKLTPNDGSTADGTIHFKFDTGNFAQYYGGEKEKNYAFVTCEYADCKDGVYTFPPKELAQDSTKNVTITIMDSNNALWREEITSNDLSQDMQVTLKRVEDKAEQGTHNTTEGYLVLNGTWKPVSGTVHAKDNGKVYNYSLVLPANSTTTLKVEGSGNSYTITGNKEGTTYYSGPFGLFGGIGWAGSETMNFTVSGDKLVDTSLGDNKNVVERIRSISIINSSKINMSIYQKNVYKDGVTEANLSENYERVK